MKEWQEELEVTQDGMHEGWKARWKDWKRKEEKRGGFLCSLLLSGEVFESAALFKDGLGELLEHSVHVGALPRPQPLQEADVATVTRDEQRQVGILLHHLHWDGCGGKEREGDAPWAFAVGGRNPSGEAAESSPWDGEKTSSAAFRHSIGTCTDFSLWHGLASW